MSTYGETRRAVSTDDNRRATLKGVTDRRWEMGDGMGQLVAGGIRQMEQRDWENTKQKRKSIFFWFFSISFFSFRCSHLIMVSVLRYDFRVCISPAIVVLKVKDGLAKMVEIYIYTSSTW